MSSETIPSGNWSGFAIICLHVFGRAEQKTQSRKTFQWNGVAISGQYCSDLEGKRENNMFCQKCGEKNAEGVNFCSKCGANITALNTFSSAVTLAGLPDDKMTFGNAISTCMGKYADFKGRASRPEYWWFYLFTLLICWGSMIADHSGAVFGIVNLALLLPSLAASARRLHDTNRSGWWMLIAITVIGLIPLTIWLASKGNEQSNRYGAPV